MFEDKLKELEKIVQELEAGKLNLEDSVKKFEEGMQISKDCNEMLQNAEKRINILIKKEDEITEESFVR